MRSNWLSEYEVQNNDYFVIHVECNKVVANKIEKFFKLTKKHNVLVCDIYIKEWAHPSWLPEMEGAVGGYFRVIVYKPTYDFLTQIYYRLPMTRVSVTESDRFLPYENL
jgi:hypothetical protein